MKLKMCLLNVNSAKIYAIQYYWLAFGRNLTRIYTILKLWYSRLFSSDYGEAKMKADNFGMFVYSTAAVT